MKETAAEPHRLSGNLARTAHRFLTLAATRQQQTGNRYKTASHVIAN